MTAYVVAFVDVKDPDKYESQYLPPLLDTLQRYGGKILASTDLLRVKEPPWPIGRTVVIQFSNIEDAENWYASDDYRPLIKLRSQVASSSLAMLEGKPF